MEIVTLTQCERIVYANYDLSTSIYVVRCYGLWAASFACDAWCGDRVGAGCMRERRRDGERCEQHTREHLSTLRTSLDHAPCLAFRVPTGGASLLAFHDHATAFTVSLRFTLSKLSVRYGKVR